MIVTNVNLQITPTSRIGLLGMNGAGKSTLIKSLVGDLALLRGTRYASELLNIGYFAQHQMDALDGAASPMLQLSRIADKKISEATLRAFLGSFGFSGERMDTPSESFSGGERARLALALIVWQRPNVLILDEPTNHLDLQAIEWLENFLMDYEGLIIVVSHDRYFLNNVCTSIVDVDYGKIRMYVGNYEFWYESSQMVQKMMKDQNRKNEDKIKDLQLFIQRFSANKSKSKQATSRRKLLDKLTVDEMPASSRRYPFVGFALDREPGKEILTVEGLSKTIDGRKILNDVSFRVNKGDKIAFVGENELAKTTLFRIVMEEMEADAGSLKWGTTISTSYFPLDNSAFFNDCNLNLVEWLGQYTSETTESFMRSFLGRMLFSGDEVFKPVKVLSGGEKVRCMLSRIMLFGSNALVLDQPTNHLDLESITAVNKGLIEYKGVVLFASHDHEFVQTVANRIIEFQSDGTIIDKACTYDDYIELQKAENAR
ncbi:ABC-F family ATP-binding cassette domain-containing protein [Oscillibacter sp.]|uniref:ABC-F family ATP-binding cassette domain-containing protein n=1 Tax=Oscillibacter sp. TaxID=1945593 RepID=UPI0037C53062